MSNPAFVLLGLAAGVAGTLVFANLPVLMRTEVSHIPCRQSYPNIPGTLLLDNDKVVVQRFTFPPGQWEGVHTHPPNQLYISLTDGQWKVRYGEKVEVGPSVAGTVGWYGPVELSQDHESVNIGDDPIDLIWVTLKETCTDKT